MNYPIGTRIRVTETYPKGEEEDRVRPQDRAYRGKLGTVVSDDGEKHRNTDGLGFVPVTLDGNKTWGYFWPEEIEETK